MMRARLGVSYQVPPASGTHFGACDKIPCKADSQHRTFVCVCCMAAVSLHGERIPGFLSLAVAPGLVWRAVCPCITPSLCSSYHSVPRADHQHTGFVCTAQWSYSVWVSSRLQALVSLLRIVAVGMMGEKHHDRCCRRSRGVCVCVGGGGCDSVRQFPVPLLPCVCVSMWGYLLEHPVATIVALCALHCMHCATSTPKWT
jgi:hypothetical protein